jgi:Smg protein
MSESGVNEKTIEILIQLLGHIRDNSFDMESLNEFTENLVDRGYNEREVSEAIGWLFDRFNLLAAQSSDAAEPSVNSVRVLHDFERMKIPPEAYGYLLKLRSLGIIDGSRMEKVIDYFMVVGFEGITERDIDDIVATILFEER